MWEIITFQNVSIQETPKENLKTTVMRGNEENPPVMKSRGDSTQKPDLNFIKNFIS
jgi:hypothetical protein